MTNNRNRNRNRRRRRARAARRRNQAAPDTGRAVKFAPCTMHYMRAIADPFATYDGHTRSGAEVSTLPCVIDDVTVPSYKYSTVQRFTVEPTNGQFSITIRPHAAFADVASHGGLASPFIRTTLQGSTWTNASEPDNIINPQNLPCSGSPISSTDWSTGKYAYRLVGCGIRLRYNGPALYRAGTIYAYSSEDGHAMYGRTPALTAASIQALPTTSSWAIADSDVSYEMAYRPIAVGDFSYKQDGAGVGGAGMENTDWSDDRMTLFGFCNNEARFHCEVVSFWEATGQGLPGRSPSHSDPSGFAAIGETATKLPSAHATHGEHDGYISMFVDMAKSALLEQASVVTATQVVNAGRLAYSAFNAYRNHRAGAAAHRPAAAPAA